MTAFADQSRARKEAVSDQSRARKEAVSSDSTSAGNRSLTVAALIDHFRRSAALTDPRLRVAACERAVLRSHSTAGDVHCPVSIDA